MVADAHQNFEAGTVGSSVATGSGGSGNTGVVAVGTAPLITSTSPISGTKSADCVAAAGAASNVNLPYVPSTKAVGHSVYFRLVGPGSTFDGATENIAQWRAGGSNRVQVKRQITTGKMQVTDATSGGDWTSPSAIPMDTDLILDICIDSGTTTTDGKVKFQLRKKSDLTFAAGMTAAVELTGRSNGAGAIGSNWYAGLIGTTGTAAREMLVDEMYATDSYAFTGPGANASPAVNPGAAQTISGTTGSLSGSATDDVSLASLVWALQSTTASTSPTVGTTSNTGGGTTSMTATASVTGLTPGTHVFKLTATDNGSPALVTVGTVTFYVPQATVLPNRVISNAGAWVAVNAASIVAAVAKSADDDTSYIETPATPSAASIIFGVEPISAGDETIPFRARYTGTGTFTCTPKLYSGTTLITTASAPITLTGSFANYSLALSSGENAAVANKNDVRIELVANQS